MAPVFKAIALALVLSLGSAERRGSRPKSPPKSPARTEINDSPSVTNSPDDNDSSPSTNRITTKTTRRTSRTKSQTSCPTNQASYSYDGDNYCCPGSFYGADDDTLCGVSCSGGPADVTASLPSGRTCASTIMITDDGYSSKVAAATSRAGTATSPGAAAMVTSGPWMGALVVAGGVVLAV